MFGKNLVTHQTGPEGKLVDKIYIEEKSQIKEEFYLSCLVDRATSKIAFISSREGGVNIEEIAKQNPEKIITDPPKLYFLAPKKCTGPEIDFWPPEMDFGRHKWVRATKTRKDLGSPLGVPLAPKCDTGGGELADRFRIRFQEGPGDPQGLLFDRF